MGVSPVGLFENVEGECVALMPLGEWEREPTACEGEVERLGLVLAGAQPNAFFWQMRNRVYFYRTTKPASSATEESIASGDDLGGVCFACETGDDKRVGRE